jgi:hypothetical protein
VLLYIVNVANTVRLLHDRIVEQTEFRVAKVMFVVLHSLQLAVDCGQVDPRRQVRVPLAIYAHEIRYKPHRPPVKSVLGVPQRLDCDFAKSTLGEMGNDADVRFASLDESSRVPDIFDFAHYR